MSAGQVAARSGRAPAGTPSWAWPSSTVAAPRRAPATDMPDVDDLTTLAALPPISLAELTATADLQTRLDRKYVVPTGAIDAVLRGVEDGARALQIDGERAFDYRSMYFDTTDLTGFHGAATRRRRRFKVRTRSYPDGQCFLEVKTRDGRGRNVKRRAPHPLSAAERLREEDSTTVGSALAAAGIDPAEVGTLLAVAGTSYTRATILLPASGARVTIDRGLTWSDMSGRELRLTDLAIVETKSPRAASGVDRALWHDGYRPRSISKYATGMTLLYPELAANRWSRIKRDLAGHLREDVAG